MDKCRVNIVIIEPSDIVFEGLANLLLKNEGHFFVYRLTGIDELIRYAKREHIDNAIINPNVFINKTNEFVKLRKNYNNITWTGLVYSYFENDLIAKFDDILNITDTEDEIISRLKRNTKKCDCHDQVQSELSEREAEVLLLLVKGLSNKEIADKLNISIHTVISHRKNIIEKTGIKSLPGLTIYAISKKIVPLGTS
ncbi:MAG: helix-turn-helix transcriptional regulator [Bacteroidales bacterium]|nr:helix-turn-helix transcriptional regulator [Bacteroidales bacterium]